MVALRVSVGHSGAGCNPALRRTLGIHLCKCPLSPSSQASRAATCTGLSNDPYSSKAFAPLRMHLDALRTLEPHTAKALAGMHLLKTNFRQQAVRKPSSPGGLGASTANEAQVRHNSLHGFRPSMF